MHAAYLNRILYAGYIFRYNFINGLYLIVVSNVSSEGRVMILFWFNTKNSIWIRILYLSFSSSNMMPHSDFGLLAPFRYGRRWKKIGIALVSRVNVTVFTCTNQKFGMNRLIDRLGLTLP